MRALFFIVSILIVAYVVMSSFRTERELTPFAYPDLYLFPEINDEVNSITEEGVELGRYLFYDKRLSADGSISCGSCHKQHLAFADDKAFSIGVNGDTLLRNTPPLYNLAWYDRLFWDGKSADIESQVHHPLRSKEEMNMDWKLIVKRLRSDAFYRRQFRRIYGKNIDSSLVVRAIGEFERSLISANSKYDQALKGERYFSKDEYDGFVLMNDQNKGNCLHCHTTDGNALGTTGGFSNNGLTFAQNISDFRDTGLGGVTQKKEDYGKFKIPSLRNIELTAPYMHDGRFKTLEEVLHFYANDVKNSPTLDSKMGPHDELAIHLTEEEQRKIIAFLKTLTDSSFIHDPRFSDPYLSP